MDLLPGLKDFVELKDLIERVLDDFKSGKRSRAASVIAAFLLFFGPGVFYKGFLPGWLTTLVMLAGLYVWSLGGANRGAHRATLTSNAFLKGARPFGSTDGHFYKRLGRAEELSQLKDWIVTEQVGVILLWGSCGVGKTSLVNAGLREVLQYNAAFVYFDADQENFELGLRECLRQRIDNLPPSSLTSLEEIIRDDRTRKQAIVIDDADLAREPTRIKNLVSLSLSQGPPYKRVFILIFEENYYIKHWQHVNWEPNDQNVKKLPLSHFSVLRGEAVVTTLARQARLRLSGTVIREIASAATIDDGPEPVSPLSIGVILQPIGRAVSGGGRFQQEVYSAFGEATGAMITYLRDHLAHLGPRDWRQVLVAIADQVATGSREFLASSLKVPNWSEADLKLALDSLSSQELRVLRTDHDRLKFTVLVEWLKVLEVLRRPPEPSRVSFEERVSRRFKEWSDRWDLDSSALSRGLREGRLLLSRRDVRQVDRNRGIQRFWGDLLFAEYFSRSRLYRTAQRVAVILALLSFVPASISSYRMIGKWRTASIMKKWGLPADLGEYSEQLEGLAVGCRVDKLRWLPRSLKYLDANCDLIKSLDGAPPDLRHLGLSRTNVKSLVGLPASVVSLDISETKITDFESLQSSRVNMLDVSGLPCLKMNLIPRSVTNLKLQHPDLQSLTGLPGGLIGLELRGSSVRSLKDLPSSLQRLLLEDNPALVIDSLPSSLETLQTDRFTKVVNTATALKTLILVGKNSPMVVDKIPDMVRELELKNATVANGYPTGLRSLKVHDGVFAVPLEKLPSMLAKVKLRWSRGVSLDLLPKHLEELDLSWSDGLSSLNGIGKIKALNISKTEVRDLGEVPDSVTNLVFEFCTAKVLRGFPKQLEILDLGGCKDLEIIENLPTSLTELHLPRTSVATLPNLPEDLVRLDISNTEISGKLPKLPAHLKWLTVSVGQFKTLEGLPGSVRRLVFVEADRMKGM